jgi:ABC-2 type transport system permease protein
MKKIILVAMQEYKRNVWKKSFLLAILSLPMIILLGVGLGIVITNLENNNLPVGYIDHAGLFSEPIRIPAKSRTVEFIAYESQEKAQRALENGETQAFYVVSGDYLTSNTIELFYIEEPGKNATRQFHDFVQLNLVALEYSDIAERVARGSNLILRSIDAKRELPDGEPPLSVILPLIISFAIVILLLMSSGYMMHAVVEEKENRTIEVVITSVSPTQLMGGKVLGVLGISFTQLVVWIVFGFMALVIVSQGLGIEWFQNLTIDWFGILLIVFLAIPTYVTASALMMAIGSTVTETQEAQWVVSIFMMLFWIPLWLLGIIGNAPNAPLPMLLSFLPFTSLMTISIRNMFIFLPYWQIGISIISQIMFGAGAVWLAGKAFRVGMLRYGQKVSFKEVIGKSAGKIP